MGQCAQFRLPLREFGQQRNALLDGVCREQGVRCRQSIAGSKMAEGLGIRPHLGGQFSTNERKLWKGWIVDWELGIHLRRDLRRLLHVVPPKSTPEFEERDILLFLGWKLAPLDFGEGFCDCPRIALATVAIHELSLSTRSIVAWCGVKRHGGSTAGEFGKSG